MRCSTVLAACCGLAIALSAPRAEAQVRIIYVVVHGGEASPALITALGAELAASGYRALFVRDASYVAPTDPVLDVLVEGDRAVASLHRGPGSLASVRLPDDDTESTALAAASLVAEIRLPPLRLGDPRPRMPATRGALALGRPGPPVPIELLPDVATFNLELGGSTAIGLNGGTLSVGVLFVDALLVRLHGRVLASMSDGSLSTLAEASFGYSARVGATRFELGGEIGALAVALEDASWNTGDDLGVVLGAFGGMVFEEGSALAPAVQLSLGATWLREGFMFVGLASFSVRWSVR